MFHSLCSKYPLLVECMTSDVDATGKVDCPVNDLLVKLLPVFNQTCLEVTDVTNACAIHSLLQNTPHVIVHRIQITAVQWP